MHRIRLRSHICSFVLLSLLVGLDTNATSRVQVSPESPTGLVVADAAGFSVVTSGCGRDIVLVGGLVSPPSAWTSLKDALGDGYRFHTLTISGLAGAVATSATPQSVADVGMALVHYLKQYPEPPVVVAHSASGVAALHALRQAPTLTKVLIVLDALPMPAENAGAKLLDDKLIQSFLHEREQFKTSGKDAFTTRIEREVSQGMNHPERAKEIIEAALKSDPGVYGDLYASVMATDLRGSLDSLRHTLFVLYADQQAHGAPSGFMRQRYISQYSEVPQAQLVEIRNARHYLMVDQPHRVADAISDILIDRDVGPTKCSPAKT